MAAAQTRGIASFGAYLPRHILDRTEIRSLLGQGGGKGTRTVAGYDEDSTSMGVESGRAALWQPDVPSSLHFATTAPAYADKTNATTVHAALGLPGEVFATDYGASVRSAVGAFRAAAAAGGLAVFGDVRTGRPGSSDEARGGDGAASFLFGSGESVVAEILAFASATSEFLDRWRVPGALASGVWEERFGLVKYLPLMQDAAQRALAAGGVEQPSHVIVSSPHSRAAKTATREFGPAASDELEDQIGYLGAADVAVRLVDVLERAQPGETILVVSGADGADAVLLRTTGALARRPVRPSLRDQLAHARTVAYPTFLTWRGFLDREPPRRPDPIPPDAPPTARAAAWKFALRGSCCTNCRRVHVPPSRVCPECGAVDAFELIDLANRRATVSTYTIDHLAYSLSPPTISAAVDFDGGGRMTCEVTDCSPEEMDVSARVEMTFRRTYTARGIHNYFWKARPALDEKDA